MANIYKRGKTWWGRAQRAGVEHRQSLQTRDKSVAEKRLRIWLEELEASSWGGRARVSTANAARAFIVEYLPTKKSSAATRYAISLQWLSEHFGGMTIDQIGRKELTDFVSWRRGLGVSNPTIRRDLACLSSMLTFCEDREWLDDGKNPVPGFMRRMAKRGLKESPGRRRYLSEAEETALLAHCTPAVREAVIVAIETGLRSEEQFSLTWGQVDFRQGVIRTTTDTKSGKARTVPLPQRSAQILAQKKARQTNSLFVFCHEDGTRILRQNKGLAGAVRRAAKQSEFDTDFRWHDLRRTAGCRWLQRDRLSMEEVARLLGHHSVAVTEKSYAFLDEESVASGISRTKIGTGAGGLDAKRVTNHRDKG